MADYVADLQLHAIRHIVRFTCIDRFKWLRWTIYAIAKCWRSFLASAAVDIRQKARRRVVLHTPIQHTARGVRHDQLLARASHAHITQPALFLKLILVKKRATVWENTFLAANHEDRRKLK